MEILVNNVTKQYGKNTALNKVSTRFEVGHIYGLLGENGAGKSTLIKLICNFAKSTGGVVQFAGSDVFENECAQQNFALMSDYSYFPDGDKVTRLFERAKSFDSGFDINLAIDLAKKFKLDTSKKFKALSTGYKSILKFLVAISSNKPFIFLDEPILGLDANHRDLVYKTVLQVFEQKECSIIVSTHMIEEISTIVDHVIFIKNGKIVIDEERDSLLNRAFVAEGRTETVQEYVANKQVISQSQFGGIATCYFFDNKKQSEVQGIEVSHATLQNLFIKMCNSEVY